MLRIWLVLAYLFRTSLLETTDDDTDSDTDPDTDDVEEDDDTDTDTLVTFTYDPNDWDSIKDPAPKLAAMQDHIDRLHRRLEQNSDERVKVQADQIEQKDRVINRLNAELKKVRNGQEPEDTSPLRIEATFWRELATGDVSIADHETAWDLFTARGFADTVQVADDGEVSGIDKALAKLLDRYPWLSDEQVEIDTDAPTTNGRTASPPKKKRGASGTTYDRAALQKRMPALRRHG